MNDRSEQVIAEKEGSRKMLIGLILTSVVLAGFAQITLKSGWNKPRLMRTESKYRIRPSSPLWTS